MKHLYISLLFILSVFSVEAQLTGISPNSGIATQTLNTTVSSNGMFQTGITPSGNIYEMHLEKGTSIIPILDWMTSWSNNVVVVNQNDATASFTIPGNADTGLYDLSVTLTDINFWGSNLVTITLTGGFMVNPPDGYITGKVYYDSNLNGMYDTGEPLLSNQSIQMQPGNINVLTDANGNYSLGAMNGTYTVSYITSSQHSYAMSSDSASFTVTMNNANQGGFDFGVKDLLSGISPSVAFQSQMLNAILTSDDLFVPGANSWGNITSFYLQNQTSSSWYPIPLSSLTILDTNRVQILYLIPLTTPVGTYRVRLYTGTTSWWLENALVVNPAPSLLSGHIYYDANNNGAFDTGELPVSSQKVSMVPDNSYAFTDGNGDFLLGASLGSHTISWTSTSSQYVLSSQPSYSFTNSGNQSGFDFGLRSALPDYSGTVNFYPAFMRCNQYVTSFLYYTNTSNAVSQGTVYFVHSPNVTWGYANPPRSSFNGDTAFWNFSNLQPFETRSIAITTLNPGVGASVSFSSHADFKDGSGTTQVSVNGNNFQTIVRCSFDPNDKAVIPEGVDDVMHYTLINDPLQYLIRFQNSGNDTAFTVFIRDTIDASLDLSTFELLDASHSVEVQIDSNRAVTFQFNNILLPDSNVDEPNSHGFVSYRIHPLAGIPDPTRIENQAFIYFDMNPAIETNITWNTMVNQIPVGLESVVNIDNAVSFYPNPMDKNGQFVFKNEKSEKMLITLYDVSGKEAVSATTTNTSYQLNRGNLESGLYFFRLMNTVTGESHSGKITIR